jgi:WXXGXW repeat (2 copies)
LAHLLLEALAETHDRKDLTLMKLNGKMMAVAMMVGALGAMGCNKSDSQSSTDAVAPEENPAAATAPVVPDDQSKAGAEAATNWFESNVRVHYWAPRAPPALRVETYGAAPSSRHFWAPGYWHWSGRDYNWHAGGWQLGRENHVWVGGRWANRNGRYEWMPGHWYRRW